MSGFEAGEDRRDFEQGGASAGNIRLHARAHRTKPKRIMNTSAEKPERIPNRRSRRWIGLALAGAWLAGSTVAVAQYSIDWFKIAGGGGTSTNGPYSLTGTSGQADAGATMTNGPYALTGGFWSVVAAIQTLGAPTLTASLDPQSNSVTVSWPGTNPTWKLQSSTNLAPPVVWTEIPPPYFTSTTNTWFTEKAPQGTKVYRLHTP
jgi:hypothetical protein